MPPELFSYFDRNQTFLANGQTVISSYTCPLAHAIQGATSLPTARIHADVLINLLTSYTWNAAPIAQFARQIDPDTTPQTATRSRRSHHDQADIKHAAATYRADIARDWQAQRLEPHIRAAIWETAQLLPATTTAIEIVPHLASPQLSSQQCAAIAEMMHRPIVPCHQEALMAGVFTAWGELFRRRIAQVWSSAGLSYETLTVSLELRALPSIGMSGFAERHGNDLYIAATWGLASVFDTGLIKPDIFEIDLPSASVRAQTLGQKFCAYSLQPSQTLSSGLTLALDELSLERQSQFALQRDEINALITLARSIQGWQHPALTDGMQFNWSFGVPFQPLPIASNTHPTTTPLQLFVHDISPINRARASFWLTETLDQRRRPTPICRAIWHGSGASIGRVTAPAFVFKPPSETAAATDFPVRSHPEPGDIWVCHKIPATRLHELRHAAGLVIEAGSSTSHEVLLARDLGLPIVVGVVGIVEALNTGDRLEIDANVGDVIYYSDSFPPVQRPQDPSPRVRQAEDLSPCPQPKARSASTHPAHADQTDLRVNLSYLDRSLVIDRAWGGIGILRSEMLAFTAGLTLNPDPTPKEQAALHRWLHQQLMLAIELCDQRSVFYRVFDRLSPNAALCDRGMQLYLERPMLFDLQLKVLADLHHSGKTQLRLLLPFVRNCAELEFCWQRLERLGFDRTNSPIEVWIMAEVPSILLLLDDYCQRGISGIAIGTNDLTALLLGFDHEDGRSTAIAKAAKPTLHAAIRTLAATTASYGLGCQLCYDEIVNEPETLGDFLRAGVTALSVSLDHLPKAEAAIASIQRSPPNTSHLKLE